ncbi:MAG: nadD [Alphaproteobacteria bacterium]|nr:nadD [Alphaproteobacteria bacterium]
MLPLSLLKPPATGARRRVGLLGGSFNPAHEGHRHISLQALKRLKLDEIWWLVSPQNPLKPVKGMAPLKDRLAQARAIAGKGRIKVTDIETRLGTRYTADTIAALQRQFPRLNFVWLMGADNLAQISRWDRWQSIFNSVPIAVFDRPAYSLSALNAKAAQRYASRRIVAEQAGELAGLEPPAWTFIRSRLHPASATQIRAQRK